MYFQSHCGVFKEIYIFAVIMDLIYSIRHFKRLIFQTLSVKSKIKIYGNDRMYSKF